MQIVYSKTRDQFPLSRKKIWKKTITSAFLWVVVLLIVVLLSAPALFSVPGSQGSGILASLGPSIFLIIPAIVIVAFILVYLYQAWYFAVYYYDLNDNFVIIKKGPIAPREVTIPYERIQDVHIDQDVWDRIFGLYDVHLSSATFASGMEAHIDGVEKEAAEGLKNLLLQNLQQKVNRAKTS